MNNTIEREIFIHAGIERVWSLVSKAGFWIGDELRFDVEADEGETATVDTANYGSFPVQVERLEPPSYARYRWASNFPGDAPNDDNSTLVEFRLVEQDGGVVVHLKESGFAALAGEAATRESAYGDNVKGWKMQLDRLQDAASRVAA